MIAAEELQERTSNQYPEFESGVKLEYNSLPTP